MASPMKAKRAPAKKAARRPAATRKPSDTGKADGPAAVKKWIAATQPPNRAVAEKVDALITNTVPGVKKAVKWRQAFYGVEPHGWFVYMGSFKHFVTVGFFAGAGLKPMPAEGDKGTMRRVKIHDPIELDAKQLRAWVKQAAATKGWGKV